MKQRHKLGAARTVSFVAMFSALAAVLMMIEIPLFFAPSFYKLDISELPVLICAFYLGPVSGVVCELLKVTLELLLRGTSTAFVGEFANFAVGCSFVLPASIVYHAIKTKKGAKIAMVAGTLFLTVFGSFFNAWYLLPKFAELYGMPMDAIIGMASAVNPHINSVTTLVAFAVVPFNLLKGVLVSFLTFILYKRVEKLFFRQKSQE
ncbi:MAG: ECF transporter S component [Oscillospiraceae bacterium]|nr:ECF transporter S component [Oscillospiraceae bacterium]